MKKRLLTLAALALTMVGQAFALEVGEYGYTDTQRFKVTGANLVVNGDFSNGSEGWTNVEGNAFNAEVWNFEESVGPNGEKVLKSVSSATEGAAVCRSWKLDPGKYVIMYDIQGESVRPTSIVSGKVDYFDIFITSADTLGKKEGDVAVATVNGYKDTWKTVAYLFDILEGQNLVLNTEKLNAETKFTNVCIYPVAEVYDDRILQSKLAYVDQLLATGKFLLDTENGFVDNVVGTMRSMLGTAELDDPSNAEALMTAYEEELLAWLDLNAADMLKDEKKWSSYGDTRKQNEFGNWKGGINGRWFHKNNGGSNEITNDGDEIGYRFQGGNALAKERIAYSLKPTNPGTYMFSIDVVGHYMVGSSGNSNNYLASSTDNYVYDWNRDFKSVTVYAGREEMAADETDAEKNLEQEGQKVDCGLINNPNAHQNPQKFVVFYDVTQEMVDAGETVYFGIAYYPDPEITAKLGCNVNIANPQIRLIGVTQDLIDYQNEVAKIITQQGPLKDRLQWANEDVQKTAAEGYPYGKAALQEAIDWYQPVYDASLEVVDAEGNVKNAGYIKDCMDAAAVGEGILYSDSLLHSVQAMNSARSAYANINKLTAVTYPQKIKDAEAVRDDDMNSLGDKATFQTAIDEAKAKLAEVLAAATDETREADEIVLNEAIAALAEATEVFKASAALEPFIDIDFANGFAKNSDETYATDTLGQYYINGTSGVMTFSNANPESNVVITNSDKGIGEMTFALGVGEELLDVLRVGNGTATVAVPEGVEITDNDIVRFDFNFWLLRLTDGYVNVDLKNAEGQRIAGFRYCSYSEHVDYNDFNNEANEGMILNKTTAVANTTGDAGSHADNNKSAFSLIIDYKAQAVQGIVAGPNGTTTGKLIPLRKQVDENTPIEDNKIAKIEMGSNYKNYPGRRCWFDDLKVFKYPSQAEGPIDDGIRSVVTVSAPVKGIFNLQGQKVVTPVKGLYIINGKKYFVK